MSSGNCGGVIPTHEPIRDAEVGSEGVFEGICDAEVARKQVFGPVCDAEVAGERVFDAVCDTEVRSEDAVERNCGAAKPQVRVFAAGSGSANALVCAPDHS